MHALENLEDLSAQGHGQGHYNNAQRHVHGISDRIMCLQSSVVAKLRSFRSIRLLSIRHLCIDAEATEL